MAEDENKKPDVRLVDTQMIGIMTQMNSILKELGSPLKFKVDIDPKELETIQSFSTPQKGENSSTTQQGGLSLEEHKFLKEIVDEAYLKVKQSPE